MPILTYLDPLNTNISIFNAFDQKRTFEYIAIVSVTAEQRVQRRKMLNKMTECIFNALAFLFLLLILIKKALRTCD